LRCSVYAERELGEPVAGGPLDKIDLPGEWGCAHVVKQGEGESRWAMLTRDVELFRSLRATAIDDRELPQALHDALKPEIFEWVVPGWPDEWGTLWRELRAQGVPIKLHLTDERRIR
jgi:hypothetical protein